MGSNGALVERAVFALRLDKRLSGGCSLLYRVDTLPNQLSRLSGAVTRCCKGNGREAA